MKLKLLFLSCLMIPMLCACNHNELNDLTIREKNKTIIKEPQLPDNKDINNTESVKEEPAQEKETIITPNKQTKTNDKPTSSGKSEVTIQETKKEDQETVDETSIDYPIHKGRIDCHDESSCMDISLPIQFAYKDIISNTFYLEVISKNNQLLGYFIEYVFKENTYESNEECLQKGKEIKETLSDRITDYECNEATLKIVTDY